MKLQAVTVCVHESDSLALTLSNRDQFDRWLIVTVPGDRATIELSERHGLEVHLSRTLQPDGSDVLSGSKRAHAMAEGVDVLGDAGWVALLSSYVLLSQFFRKQLEALALESDCRYRMAGYRLCANRRVFERLKWHGLWQPDMVEQPGGGDWFQLVDGRSHGAAASDGQLPMSALLLGEGALLWGAGILDSERVPDEDRRGVVLRELLAPADGKARVLVAGYHPGMNLKAWASHCAQVFLADGPCLAQDRGDRHADAAVTALWELWHQEIVGLGNLNPSRAEDIPDRSLDLLYLPGEASVNRLIASVPGWQRKLKDGALVCGDLYGRSDWAEASLGIAHMFGPPDQVFSCGFWRRRFDPAWLPAAPDAARAGCVVIRNPSHGDPERVLASLYSVRQQWRGRIIVQDEAGGNAEMVAACARHGAEFRRGAGASPLAGEHLTIAAGTVMLRPADSLFEGHAPGPGFAASARRAIAGFAARFNRAQALGAVTHTSVDGRVRRVPARCASAWAEQKRGSALVWYGAKSPSPHAQRLWLQMQSRLALPIRIGADSTIAVIVRPDERALFERNWPTWNLNGTPTLVACAGIPGAELICAGRAPQQIVELKGKAGPRALLQALLDRVSTSRIILLPANAQAMSAAELFAAPDWAAWSAIFHSTVEVRRSAGAVPMPGKNEPLLLSISAERARQLCAVAESKPGGSLKAWLQDAIMRARAEWTISNVERWGWRFR